MLLAGDGGVVDVRRHPLGDLLAHELNPTLSEMSRQDMPCYISTLKIDHICK